MTENVTPFTRDDAAPPQRMPLFQVVLYTDGYMEWGGPPEELMIRGCLDKIKEAVLESMRVRASLSVNGR